MMPTSTSREFAIAWNMDTRIADLRNTTPIAGGYPPMPLTSPFPIHPVVGALQRCPFSRRTLVGSAVGNVTARRTLASVARRSASVTAPTVIVPDTGPASASSVAWTSLPIPLPTSGVASAYAVTPDIAKSDVPSMSSAGSVGVGAPSCSSKPTPVPRKKNPLP